MNVRGLHKMSENISKLSREVKPARMWIDGKCFNIKRRIKPSTNKKYSRVTSTIDSDNADVVKDGGIADYGFNILSHENGKLYTSFKLPDMYYQKITTHRDFKLSELEVETCTKITVPINGTNGKLTIIGEDTTSIIQARHHLHSIIEYIRYVHPPMQFLSIPLLSDEVKKNFEIFKNDVLNSSNPIEGMDESIFQNGCKLHLTMTILSLFDEMEINEAVKALHDYKIYIFKDLVTGSGPLKIQISGLDCMENNYAQVNVLYANARIVENDNVNLQKIADSIADYFYERGFVKRKENSVKLHCTLINTKYRKSLDRIGSKKRNKWQKRQSFDARSIMEQYKHYNFGICNFNSIHLSLMSSFDEDGFYKPLCVLKLNN